MIIKSFQMINEAFNTKTYSSETGTITRYCLTPSIRITLLLYQELSNEKQNKEHTQGQQRIYFYRHISGELSASAVGGSFHLIERRADINLFSEAFTQGHSFGQFQSNCSVTMTTG